MNQLKGDNDHRNDFMINLHESYAAEMGFELPTSAMQFSELIICTLSFVSCESATFSSGEVKNKLHKRGYENCAEISLFLVKTLDEREREREKKTPGS